MMWLVQLALRQKHTIIVVALAIVIFGVLAIISMPMDVLPTIDIPVVAVIWIYPGMQPQEMVSRFIRVSERVMTTTVNDIEHMESQTYPGSGVIKVYLHPGANVASAVAQVTATNQFILRSLPAGTTPPQVLQFNASNVPILQLAATSPSLSNTALFDLSYNFLRTQLATVQGTSVPTPYGGAQRQIMVDLNIPALQARDLSPNDVMNAINANNLVTPTGTVKIGQTEYNVKTNNQPDVIPDFNAIPVKTINGTVVRIGDVAYAHDSHAVPLSMVNLNGHPAVLTTILKTANASSIDVVRRVKQALPKIEATLPPDIHFQQLFDQTVYVSAAVQSVLREAVIAACLAALMVLLFLGSWRSTLVVATSIPLSILASITLLGLLGQTINIMTLGGLALSVGILVDNAMVAVENINRNLAMGGKSLTRAILDGSAQIASPTLVATLSICIVFAPVLFMTGAAKSLFLPLAEAVIFAMLASFLLSRSLVPLMIQLLVRPDMLRIVAEERQIETMYGDYLIPRHVDALRDSEERANSAGQSTRQLGRGGLDLAGWIHNALRAGAENGDIRQGGTPSGGCTTASPCGSACFASATLACCSGPGAPPASRVGVHAFFRLLAGARSVHRGGLLPDRIRRTDHAARARASRPAPGGNESSVQPGGTGHSQGDPATADRCHGRQHRHAIGRDEPGLLEQHARRARRGPSHLAEAAAWIDRALYRPAAPEAARRVPDRRRSSSSPRIS